MRSPNDPDSAGQLQRLTAAYSIGWLAAANAVGVLMALLLVRPTWGRYLGEWTYGRWAALHLDWQLYGWCSLPLVGLLLRRYLSSTPQAPSRASWVFHAWSVALLLGGFSWLEGGTSGKLFLDWTGFPKIALGCALAFLWCILFGGWLSARRGQTARDIFGLIMLVILAPVPAVLFWSARPQVYPAIDPGTGGPTGASLLGSTLGIVCILGLLPALLDLPRRQSSIRVVYWISFCLCWAVWATIRHGNSSHADWRQWAALGALIIWIPLVVVHLRTYEWDPASGIWFGSMAGWWGLLVGSGFVQFLPGVLDASKFTHSLVAHSHLAMAGFLTSMNMLVLGNLGGSAKPLGNNRLFALWNGGLILHLAILFALSGFEAADSGWLFHAPPPARLLYLARLAAGALMAAASVVWFLGLRRERNSTA